jgi:mono/diheme cytochrome c family protein
MTRIIKFAFCLIAVCAAGVMLLEVTSAQQRTVDFRRDIEPIFRENCYKCHGADKASGQLRLHLKSAGMKGGITGAVIVPGKSKESRLLHRILGEDGEARMPMGGEPLQPAQIQLISKWIDEGADWPDDGQGEGKTLAKHWAFIKPVRPTEPAVKNKVWVRNPIDRFILAAIEKRGLTPSPEASKTTLIRRLSLDLTGLPPTLEEIDDFLADTSPDAYEKLVERLLDSPHYGERWGRWWLDAARYADTNGYEKDLPRSIWPYRDWVIKAFNSDMPFDQFTTEQLAGDLLPHPTLDQRVATGFLRNSMLNQEGGVDPEQFRVEGLIDRVDAVGKAFLGLTINCAQCHTHKFDPILHKEYYRFYAFLNGDDEPAIDVPDDSVIKKRDEILAKIDQIETELIDKTPELTSRMSGWEKGMSYDSNQWTVLTDTDIFASYGVKFDKLPDGSFLAKGDNSTANNYKVTARTKLKNITGFKLEVLTDPNLPRGGPGRANDGNFILTDFMADAAPAGKPDAMAKVALNDPTTDFERPDMPVKNVIDGDSKTHWSGDAGPGRRNQDREIVFVAAQPAGFDGGTILNFQIVQKFDDSIDLRGGKPNIGRFRISVTTAANPKADPLPANVRRILAIPSEKRSRDEQREVFGFYRRTVPEWAESNKKIDDLMNEWPYGATTLSLAQRRWPRETHLFKRGDWKRPDEQVEPGTPAVLHPFPKDAPRNRLGLAKWIVDKNNPLTPRVIVNRIWQQYFGVGLVATPEDFGSRCERPSNPELLDWLAVEFMSGGAGESARAGEGESGGQGDKVMGKEGKKTVPHSAVRIPHSPEWSIKHIHRLIVNSALYRQSSKVRPGLLEADPTNQLLARAPRLRVESEIVHDIALTAAGVLSEKIGGPSVYPAIPDGVLNLGYGAPMPWPTSVGEDRYRRGMYTFWKRSVPYPALLVFDQPNGDFSCTRRISSNTPLQALTTLNDKVFVEAAQALALRVFKEGGATDRAKMIYAFRLCTGRKPDLFELQQLLSLLQQEQPDFRGNTAASVYVSSSDLNNLPENVDLHKVAAWAMVARVLLNMDETITRE